MSRAHQYHQPNAPDPLIEDDDSEVDLNLEELDPIDSLHRHPSGWGQRREDRSARGPYDQIPLKDLRTWGARKVGRRTRGLRRYNPQPEDEEDLEDLLHDGREPGTRDSAGSILTAEDNAPLLQHDLEIGSDGRGPDTGTSKGQIFSHLRLPSFMSRRSGQISRQGLSQDSSGATTSGMSRDIRIGQYSTSRFPPNAVSNAKYTPWSFLPRTLYNEFSFFFNMYFLLVALSQIIPPLRIGYLSTYIAPLAFVLAITLGKEALDDIARRRRDTEANKEEYTVLRLQDTSTDQRGKGRNSGKAWSKSKKEGRKVASSGRLTAIEEEEETLEGADTGKVSNIVVDEIKIKSRDLKVGDVLKLGKDQRVPADLVILKSFTNDIAAASMSDATSTAESLDESGVLVDPIGDPPIEDTAATAAEARQSTALDNSNPSADAGGVGETFIRTDQLDGETDWKLRLASPVTQCLDPREFTRLKILAGKPEKKVNEFVGTVELSPRPLRSSAEQANRSRAPSNASGRVVTAPLNIDNTAWANTVLASNATVLAVVVYTGAQTRQALSTSPSRSKTGLLEYEINNLTKILCALTLALSVILVALEGFNKREDQPWYVSITRFLILFSTIIPISLRVNLDMGKSVYARFVELDQDIPGAVVRTSTIPEELGRIEYLLSDKTGTLTQNEMELKKIHVGTVSYANEAMEEVASYVRQGFSVVSSQNLGQPAKLVTPSSVFAASSSNTTTGRTRREIGSRVRDIVLALALCHNVTPTTEEEEGRTVTAYQASSPDEIAIIKWTESVGLRLLHRDRHSITLQSVDSSRVAVRVRILEVFPFTSEGKRMGIIVQFFQGSESAVSPGHDAREIYFYQKGADTVMASIVASNDWLDEETANMAREGLRTLVVGRKKLSPQQYTDFSTKYKQASVSLHNRDTSMAKVVKDHLEHNLELLGVTGVEDKLQKDVKPSLELLRNAGIKIWMLTGDKVETARCVAVSAKLVSRTHYIHTITGLGASPPSLATDHLTFLRSNPTACLLIDGSSLSTLLLPSNRLAFISAAVLLPAVIACRCSPTLKADLALLIRTHTGKRVCAIGDGGNDVSMIQAADIGVGLVGKEGRQASLAADFSLTAFAHLTKLLVWHGRNSYNRSAKLAQFVIHRGLIISLCQTVYSVATHFEPHALYRDWLLVGYATVYTMAPVFSLVLDQDVDEAVANLYPELYKELTAGRALSYRTFCVWLAISVYQGLVIQGLSQVLVASVDSPRMVAVSYSVLVVNELVMVAAEVVTWHWGMVACLLGTMAGYVASVPFLGEYFDLEYVWSRGFAWRVVAICAVSLGPVLGGRVLRRTLRPPSYRKVQGI